MPHFINPMMLWGLAGVSVPILIHLLNRYRHKEVDWAAMELLRRALVVRSRQIRIEDILILILRCLAVMLIALAMARPTLQSSAAKYLGGESQVGVVIAIDGSFSMAHQPGVASRFSLAINRTQEILNTLDTGNPVSLILLGSSPRIILRNVGYDPERLRKALADLEATPERTNLEVGLEEVYDVVKEVKAPVRECYIISDMQTNTWQEISDRSRASIDNIREVASLFVLSVASGNSDNLGITRFAVASGTLRKGSLARCVAEVHNHGLRTQDRITVNLFVDGQPVDQRIVDRLGPDEAVPVHLFARLERTGNVQLSARIGRDPLMVDNTRYAVAHVSERVRVLCVDGSPATNPYDGETGYLRTALQPRTLADAARSALEVKIVPWLSLAAQRLAEYDVVVLANVPDLRDAQVAALAHFVEQGGGLIVFLGDKTSPKVMNARFRVGGRPLLPVELKVAALPREEEDGWPVRVVASDHPLAAPLAGLPQDLLDAARIKRFVPSELIEGGRTILGLGGTDFPLLAERRLGRGKILLFTTTADRDWTDLIIHPIGPILMNQAVTYLTRAAHERTFTVGQPLTVPLARDGNGDNSVVFRDPNGIETPVAVTERDGERSAQLPHPDTQGFYEIRIAAGKRPLVAAVNVDPTESDVRCLQAEAARAPFHDMEVRTLAPGDEVAEAVRQSRVGRELWRILLILALIVLATEAFLAWLFSRRMVKTSDAGITRPSDLLATAREAEA